MTVPVGPIAVRGRPSAGRVTACPGARLLEPLRRLAPLLLVAVLLGSLAIPTSALAEGGGASPSPVIPVATASPDPEPSASPGPEPSASPVAGSPAPSPPGATASPTPSPTAATSPTASPAPTPAPTSATAGAAVVITRSLYRSGAVVTQYTSYWCVPASVQTMANLILRTSDRSYATQKLLASATYRFNRYRYHGPGNDIRGWSGALNWRLPDSLPVAYRDRSYPTRTAALDAIVDAIDETGYPVGVTVWHGGHAWSVIGYRIRQVPGDRSSREILGFYVVGPLGSPRDPWPVRLMSVDAFLTNYNRYYEDRHREPWHGDYVLVRPERTTRSARDWQRP